MFRLIYNDLSAKIIASLNWSNIFNLSANDLQLTIPLHHNANWCFEFRLNAWSRVFIASWYLWSYQYNLYPKLLLLLPF